jgi:uncharacterized membrane protein YeaQ/YmgE (transglycosylase-associated protein family)
MAFFVWILIGLLVGAITQGLVRRRGDMPSNLVVGALGGLIGGYAFTHLSTAARPGFFGSMGGALALAAIFVIVGVLARRRR